ncbi:hypothetical protein [Nocardioides sp.]|uniref:hypothetical protein n=1 Tax=Nocardioides sp. TaxID=35761 RepID=UPI002D7EA4F2|nr:hypothetical protein [Nocardioides sp.]
MSDDLTRPDRGEAMDRLTRTVQALPEDEQAPYLLLALAFLASHAPDVLAFLLDRADAVVEDT